MMIFSMIDYSDINLISRSGFGDRSDSEKRYTSTWLTEQVGLVPRTFHQGHGEANSSDTLSCVISFDRMARVTSYIPASHIISQ